MANGPFKMKGMSFKNDQSPMKSWIGKLLDPAGIFTGQSAPWHPNIWGNRKNNSRGYSGAGSRWNYGQRYDAAPRGWDSSGSANPRVVRSSTGRTGTSNRSGKVIVKKRS